jgi:PAS domain S-box-containing protein
MMMTLRTSQSAPAPKTTREPSGQDQIIIQRYLALADSMPQLVWATDADGAHFYYNRRWYEYTGLTEEQSLGFGFVNALHPDDKERTLALWQRAWRNSESYEIEYRFRRHDGVYHWFIGRAMPVYDGNGTIVEWVGTCTDIDEQKRANDVLRFLVQASSLLTASLDYESTLTQFATLAVPHIADWCAIDVFEERQLRRLAVAHVDPRKVALAHELERMTPPFDPDAPTGIAAVLRTGKPELTPVIDQGLIRQAISDSELLDATLSLGLRSSMIVPLQTREHIIGAITLVSAESGRYFNEEDLELGVELARQAASAIENAQLYRDLLQFRTTLDQTRDCVFMCDPNTLRFFYINRGASDQVGYTQQELLQMTPLDIKPEFDEARYRAFIQPLIDGSVASHTFETVHRHKNGQLVPVEVTLQYVIDPGIPGRLVAVARDISERKRAESAIRASEQRFRHLADAMPMHVWITNVEGQGTYYNERWLAYTGLSQEQAQQGAARDLIHPDDVEMALTRWDEALRSGTLFECEYRMRGIDGQYRWFLLRALPYRNDDNSISHWVGTSTDIHEQ